MAIVVTHSKTLVSPDSGAEDKVYGSDYVSATSHTVNVDADTVTQAQTNGLRTTDSPQFVGVNVGHATDTTITRVSAGVIAVEGVQVATADAVTAIRIHSTCNGRLTTESGVAVSTTDRTAQATVYFTPYLGNQIGTYSGTAWSVSSFAEKSLALSGLTSGKNYDVFIIDSTLALELSAAWTNDTTRADALVLQDGVPVKSGVTTRRWLGTIRTTGTTTTEDSAGGTTTQVGGKRFVWNRYNQVERRLLATDFADAWVYQTATWRISNGATAPSNCVEYVTGDLSATVAATHATIVAINTGTARAMASIGVDNSTPTQLAQGNYNNFAGYAIGPMCAFYRGTPGLGYHYLAPLEKGTPGVDCQFSGDDGGTGEQTGLTAVIMG